MNRRPLIASLFVVVGVALVASIAIGQQPKDPPKEPKGAAAGQHEMQLPPGWTEADMQACMLAGTPGKMHEQLAKSAGVWQGKNSMWMAPDTEPSVSECTATCTPIMDGRYIKCEIAGDMPGMGPFSGFGLYGYDNVAQQFVATWVDNCGTGIMNGTGALSQDGKTMTWKYTYNCPLRKGPATIREVETSTGQNTKTFEMFGSDPKTGKEFKIMHVDYTRKP